MPYLLLNNFPAEVVEPMVQPLTEVGAESRNACGILWGYNNGCVSEIDMEIPCASWEEYCAWMNILKGRNESYLFSTGEETVGSIGTPLNLTGAAPMTPTTWIDEHGRECTGVVLVGSVGVDVSHYMSDPNCEWTVVADGRLSTFNRNIVAHFIGDQIQTPIWVEGLPFPSSFFSQLWGIDTVNQQLFMIGGRTFKSLHIYKGHIPESMALAQYYTRNATSIDAPLPFIAVEALNVFHEPFKAKISMVSVEHFTSCGSETGVRHNIRIRVKQVRPL